MKRRENGFTIIETTLVLAVTGLLITIVLAGIGSSLNHQRYTDAVNQTVDFFRGQYTQTTNTANDRPANESCSSIGITTVGAPMAIGASECLLLGKIVRSTNGQDITSYQVLALHDPSDDTGVATMSDRDVLVDSLPRQGNELDTFTVDWGAKMTQPGTNNPAQFTIMVVRTPVSGTIHTYTSNSGTTTIGDLLNPSVTPQADRKFCVDQAGFFGGSVDPVGIEVAKNAANTTGVKIISAGECV